MTEYLLRYLFTCNPVEAKPPINGLLLGLNFDNQFAVYASRNFLSIEGSIADEENDSPIFEYSIELIDKLGATNKYELSITVESSKLRPAEKEILVNAIVGLLDNEEFWITQSMDDRVFRKPQKISAKQELLEKLKSDKPYDESKLKVDKPTLEEALALFSFKISDKKKDIKKELKERYRKLQLELHPDSATGSDEKFIKLQECKQLLEDWLD